MKTKTVIGLFLCAAFVQIAVSLSMIAQREIILNRGVQFKFRTVPVDPFDAFRGRYVALRIEGNHLPEPDGIKLKNNQSVFVLIEEDEEGFARLAAIVPRPYGLQPYIRAKVKNVSGGRVHLKFPVDRYYMEEKSAGQAEESYRRRSGKRDAYITVRIKGGYAVVESLFVGGRRIEDAVRQEEDGGR